MNLLNRKRTTRMSRAVKSFASIAAIVLFSIDAVAQAPATPKQAARKGTAAQKTKELSTQIESLQSKLDQAQTQIQQQKVQIEQLQQSLQESVNALQQQQQRLQASVHQDAGGVCDHRHLLLDPLDVTHMCSPKHESREAM